MYVEYSKYSEYSKRYLEGDYVIVCKLSYDILLYIFPYSSALCVTYRNYIPRNIMRIFRKVSLRV